MTEKDAEDDNLDHDYYRYLRDSHTEATRSYDKTILTLAGGALGLSVTFVGDIVGHSPDGRAWALAGWLLLVAALVAVAASLLASEKLFWHAMHQRLNRASEWNKRTGWLNLGAGVFLSLGLGSLALFAFENL